MKQYRIMLSFEDAIDFVNAAMECDFTIDVAVSHNRFIVDAKSILGVMGLDLTQALTVTCNGYDGEFDFLMRRLAVAS